MRSKLRSMTKLLSFRVPLFYPLSSCLASQIYALLSDKLKITLDFLPLTYLSYKI
ncbi:exported hypothetical protein [uncultured Eubacteriales bacterium]|uniref:Uncharacterized protein n=1 Tax=uncultured Eubacteriales bacterium TaxID=172733 RepID=A0A212K185_9FIRM|nr:exported hypothetical protein [uncultured Eubacteriales bacterium]